MCGILGFVYANPNAHVNQALVDGLTLLQHRGQDAAGIVTSYHNRLNMKKDNGTVADVFTQDNIIKLKGNIGIGHVRYPTAGGSCSAEAQPFYTNYPFGIALAHNGNLTNTNELLDAMHSVHRHINTDSDSEILLNVFADELQRRHLFGSHSSPSSILSPDDLFDALTIVMRKCRGGYSVILLINGIGILAFRDPNGIRPLCFGKRKTATGGYDYAIASESVAVQALTPSFKLERDVLPGEAVFISSNSEIFKTRICSNNNGINKPFAPCLFEFVYFARPDSILDGVKVYDARGNMGEKLAKKILKIFPNHDIDYVIPIPETSRTAALQCAHILQKPYREGYVKNRYIARTFIMPGQEARRKTVRLKLNTIYNEFENKNVLLIDDSIVRGTTSIELIQMAREAGAKKVYFASAAPPVRFPNVYGIDIPTRQELIAHGRTEEEIAHDIGADLVIYNDLEDVIDAVCSLNPSHITRLDDSCFSGHYITDDVTPQYLQLLEQSRGAGRGSRSGSPNPYLMSKVPFHHQNQLQPQQQQPPQPHQQQDGQPITPIQHIVPIESVPISAHTTKPMVSSTTGKVFHVYNLTEPGTIHGEQQQSSQRSPDSDETQSEIYQTPRDNVKHSSTKTEVKEGSHRTLRTNSEDGNSFESPLLNDPNPQSNLKIDQIPLAEINIDGNKTKIRGSYNNQEDGSPCEMIANL